MTWDVVTVLIFELIMVWLEAWILLEVRRERINGERLLETLGTYEIIKRKEKK